jgi:hypothetical protein
MSSISPFQVPDVTTSGNSTNGMLTDGKVNFFDILGYKPNVGLNAAGASKCPTFCLQNIMNNCLMQFFILSLLWL